MKLNSSDIKHLKAVASQLPICYTSDGQKTLRLVYGSQLLEAGHKDVKGKPINPEAKYAVQTGEGVQVNHYKHLKRLCEDKRYKEAQEYIDSVQSISNPHIDLMQSMNQRRPTI